MTAVIASSAAKRIVATRAIKASRLPPRYIRCIQPFRPLQHHRCPQLVRPTVVPACKASISTYETESQKLQKTSGFLSVLQNVAKTAMITALAVALALGVPSTAEAARSGGRAGGSSFSSRGSSSSRSYSSPSSTGGMGMGSRMTGGYSSYSGYSAPAVTYVPSVVVPMNPVGVGYYGGGSSALILFFILAVLAMTVFAPSLSSDSDVRGAGAAGVSVMKVQVGLLGVARSLKNNLDSIAAKADTSDPEGLNFLLQEVSLALLRNPDYYVYGAASSEVLKDNYSAEKAYNKASMEERSKFREETFSNVGGVTRRKAMTQQESGVNELMVVTIVIAAEGRCNLPPVRNSADLKNCLNYIASIGASKLIGVELLWTPQAEGDFYTRDEVIADYPNLVPLV